MKWEIQLSVYAQIILSATVKELLKSVSRPIYESYAQMKNGAVFFDSQCSSVSVK